MDAELNTIIIYARNIAKTADFYRKYFGFTITGEVLEGLVELTSGGRGLTILVHQAAKSIKLDQAGVNSYLAFRILKGLNANVLSWVWCLEPLIRQMVIHFLMLKTLIKIPCQFQVERIKKYLTSCCCRRFAAGTSVPALRAYTAAPKQDVRLICA